VIVVTCEGYVRYAGYVIQLKTRSKQCYRCVVSPSGPTRITSAVSCNTSCMHLVIRVSQLLLDGRFAAWNSQYHKSQDDIFILPRLYQTVSVGRRACRVSKQALLLAEKRNAWRILMGIFRRKDTTGNTKT
jgi:hypothetical protein